MPGLDRTGPEGKGPKTGRMQGRCSPETDVELRDYPPGRGRGWKFRLRNQSDTPEGGRGLGRRWRW